MAGRASGETIVNALRQLEAACRQAAATYGQAGVICFETAYWPMVRGQWPRQIADNVYRECTSRL